MTNGSGTPGLIIAAPASGSGKTTVALAVLRALRQSGRRVASFKTGPDYIDPAFHAAATGRPCLNLDPWGMRRETLETLVTSLSADADIVIGEGVMGLFDGAADGTGSTADLAALTGWPVILVVDVRGQAASVAAAIRGFATHRADVAIAGVIFNRVASERHAEMLQTAMAETDLAIPVLGCLGRHEDLEMPERHLGLVQAGERGDLDAFLDRAAGLLGEAVDLAGLQDAARPTSIATTPSREPSIPLLGQRIAVARDTAFAFCYPHVLDGWRAVGAEIGFFSPLNDEGPTESADAVYLPGGYPELHAGRLAAASGFREAMHRAALRGAFVYGECGGYMTLGEGLTDADGRRHAMLGLLPLETSFAERARHLGYRRITLESSTPLGREGSRYLGHEFHYATILHEGAAAPFASATDARGRPEASGGLVRANVAGSFLHLIDRTA